MDLFKRHLALGNVAIVIIFAVLHFVTALLSRALDYHDDILLTILTIAMVVVISIRNSTRIEMVTLLTLVATISGFIIGSWLWQPMTKIIGDIYIAPAVSTFLITTVIGLAVNSLTLRVKRFRSSTNVLRSYVRNVILVALGILLVRLLYVALFRLGVFNEGTLLNHIFGTMENTWALLTLIAGNVVLFAYLPSQGKETSKRLSISKPLLISLLVLPLVATLLIYYDIPHLETPATDPLDFVRTLSAALMIDILIATACILIRISTTTQRELREERELKHRTEYQYERLKQQINPHFLFNSLGILDYLVQEHETERASAFIRKLAGIYRYMLNNDQKPLVKIGEELEFANMYIDLLAERFPQGMKFEIEVEREFADKYVVPCALQLLVENATKHNVVSEDSPLCVRIAIEGGYLVVRNNLQLRTHGQPSTHLGLENIRRQYLDITHRDIVVQKTDNEFIVKLPIV
jgi:sensor histidine kinase YesM